MTSALLVLFLSKLYSSFLTPTVRRKITVSFPVGKRWSELSKTISTVKELRMYKNAQRRDEPYADKVVVAETPSCKRDCRSSFVIEV